MNNFLLLFGFLTIAVAEAQSQIITNLVGPPLHPSANEAGIRWVSRAPEWQINSRPVFLRDKAFSLETMPIEIRGMFLTFSNPGGDGQGSNFLCIALRAANSNAKSSTYYNATTGGWSYYSPLFSPQTNKVVARFGYPPDDTRNFFNLILWNLASGEISRPKLYSKEEAKQEEPQPSSAPYFNSGVSWSPGGRYISYTRGGNSVGGFTDALGNLYSEDGYELWLNDTKVPDSFARRLATNIGLSWSWTHRGTLLFSPLDAGATEAVRLRWARPSVHEVDLKSGVKTKLFDGGYFAHESPDGQWIAFVDWPGPVIGQSQPTPQQEAENAQVKPGVYLFHRPTKRRVLVGEFPATPPFSVALQWTPNSQRLLVFNTQEKAGAGLDGVIYRMDITQQTLEKVGQLEVTRPFQTTNTSNFGWFEFRGTSPDGRRAYANTSQYIDEGPSQYVNLRHKMWSIDTETGQPSLMASLTDIATENPGWDWRDESGINPAFAAAQKVEESLPTW